MERRSTPSVRERPILSPVALRRRVERLNNCITALKAFDPEKLQNGYGFAEVTELEAAIEHALSSAFGLGTCAVQSI